MSNGFVYRGPYSDRSEEEIIERLNTHTGRVAVDTETVNTNDHTLIGLGLYIRPNEGFYFRAFPDPSPYLPVALGIISDISVTQIFHN